jgi:hypothetical protein
MYVYKNPQRQWLAATEQELEQRLHERMAVDRRIAELKQIIKTLKPVVKDADEMDDISLPQLCLRVLSFTGPMYQSATQIRDGLKTMGLNVFGNNPMGVIHTMLGRLAKDGHAEARLPRPGAPLEFRITTAGRVALQNK